MKSQRGSIETATDSPGKNILSWESAVEIRGFGWLVRWDDEFQINGLWLRQASRCKVSAANGAGNSSQRGRWAQPNSKSELGCGDSTQLGGSRNGSRRRALMCRRYHSLESSSLLLEVQYSSVGDDRGKSAVVLRCSGGSRFGRCDRGVSPRR